MRKKIFLIFFIFLLSFSIVACSSKTKEKGDIKGNINSNGEKIYHMPDGAYYDKTDAEQWFKTEAEAKEAGFRKSKK
ncbi:MAG: fold metallo-hydrolase [Anaerocolumna sp.]|jgi:hypothetical protein|nr:fold metallo-hydrolase [Anaerocolumna sp.]